MKKSFLHNAWLTAPVFFLLLPVFFVLHGMQQHAGFIPATDALLLLLMYTAAGLVLYGLCWWLFRNRAKAGLGSFLLLAFNFFFGGLHDLFGNPKYSIVLPVALIAFIIVFIWLKRTRANLLRTSAYLNLLLIVLIAWDAVMLALPRKTFAETTTTWKLPNCDTCTKPDLYLVLLDEYAGNGSLKDLFQFDNAAFEQQLRDKGFYVANHSHSNYNYTPFSMASMLNMQYLQLQDTNRLQHDLNYTLNLIKENQVRRMLEAGGYTFYNYSVFDLPQQPAPIDETAFIPARTRLVTAQTFLSRLNRDLGYHLLATFKLKSAIDRQQYRALRVNTRLYELTWNMAGQQHQQPIFVYTHLMMPHYPYYFDRNEKPMDPSRVLPEINNRNRKDYVEYLQYTNKKILQLTDHIQQSAKRPTAIVIMSDHGFRHFNEPVERKYHFMNLNAVYLPHKNYSGFHDSVSNVNQFRIIFNSLFRADFPMLPDSTIYLKD